MWEREEGVFATCHAGLALTPLHPPSLPRPPQDLGRSGSRRPTSRPPPPLLPPSGAPCRRHRRVRPLLTARRGWATHTGPGRGRGRAGVRRGPRVARRGSAVGDARHRGGGDGRRGADGGRSGRGGPRRCVDAVCRGCHRRRRAGGAGPRGAGVGGEADGGAWGSGGCGGQDEDDLIAAPLARPPHSSPPALSPRPPRPPCQTRTRAGTERRRR